MKRFFVVVGFLGLLNGMASLNAAEAATGQSWVPQQPAWAAQPATHSNSGSDNNDPGTTVVKRSSYRRQAVDSNISPYSPDSNNLALDIGQVFLMGDLGNHYSDSIGGQLHYTYGVSNMFGFDGSVGYSSHSDGKFSMATALMGLRTNLSYFDRLIPYTIFGLGFYKPTYSYENAANTGQDTLSPVLFGVHLGFGIDLEVTREIFFGAGLTLHDIFGSDRSTPAGTISTGGTYTSFLLHAGYTF